MESDYCVVKIGDGRARVGLWAAIALDGTRTRLLGVRLSRPFVRVWPVTEGEKKHVKLLWTAESGSICRFQCSFAEEDIPGYERQDNRATIES